MRKSWIRLNVIVGYPILLVLDLMIAMTSYQSFFDAHRWTLKRLERAWNQ